MNTPELNAGRLCAFIIANGAGDKFRTWGQSGPEWTSERDKALQFARRQDAEAVAAEDEDAWLIVPLPDNVCEELLAALKDANQLCRSAYQIAARNGAQTSWRAFLDQLEKSLKRQQSILAQFALTTPPGGDDGR